MDNIKKRSIIHLDLDAFFASVEQRENPQYADKPLVVGGIFKKDGKLSRRGVVCSASYQARNYGIHAGMPIWEAQQKCPGATFTPSRMNLYRIASQQFFRICSTYTPFLEPVSIDEAFLDVTSCKVLFGTAEEIALNIKNRVKKELHLPVSAGIASSKFLAKIATNLGKPDGFFVLPDEQAMDILSDLPVTKLWGIGQKAAQ
ncbi:MAG TPA: DNA polymerase IV, partial [Atribacterota bacterium]|nr:DNA polymerase IV [Atribacterota bacterium]